MAIRKIGNKDSDGTSLGQSNSDKISFYGVTCITRRSVPASLTAAATTAAQNAAINKIRNLLKNLGLGVA
jgi:hypothetical protein